MSFFHTIILGIVEGITEFLPISSTAHLEIFHNLLLIPTSDFVKSFEIAIQLGAILAVVFLYRKNLCSSWIYFRNIIIAFIPTGIIGFLLYQFIKSFLMGNLEVVASALILGGIVIIFFEKREENKIEDTALKTIEMLSIKELLILGCAQTLAVIPGVSRSGAVIVSGRLLGLPKNLITEFSFLLAIPTMLSATAYDLFKSGFLFSSSEWGNIALGFIVAFFAALVVVKWLINYIKNHSFSAFGWYRIVLGISVFYLLIW